MCRDHFAGEVEAWRRRCGHDKFGCETELGDHVVDVIQGHREDLNEKLGFAEELGERFRGLDELEGSLKTGAGVSVLPGSHSFFL